MLKRKSIPLFIKRDKRKEEQIELKYLDEVYELIKNIIQKNDFKTIDEYDKVVGIHYSLYQFFERYSQYLINRLDEDNKYINKLDDLITFFYSNFELNGHTEFIFLERKNTLFRKQKKIKEMIEILESKLFGCRCLKYDIYCLLFDNYYHYYEYDKAISKMNNLIENEKDDDLREDLITLKLEEYEDNYDLHE